MQTENKLFDIIDYVLKKTNYDIALHENSNIFILNRWLSMSDVNIAKIINSTSNRWFLKNSHINFLKFYRSFLPKINKKIKYIKKPLKIKTEETTDILKLARNFELSSREIEMYENTIDFLNQNSN
jgi:hypothetical protein